MRRFIALEDDEESNEGAGNNRWMISYADFITLLFVLFLALYARMPKLADNGTQTPNGQQAQTARDTRAPADHVETVAQTLAPPPPVAKAPEAASGDRQVPLIVAQAPAASSTPAPAPTPTAAPREPDAQTLAALRRPNYGGDIPRPVVGGEPMSVEAAQAQQALQRAAQSQQAAAQAAASAPPATLQSWASPNTPASAPQTAQATPNTPAQRSPASSAPPASAPPTLMNKLSQAVASQEAAGNVTLSARNDGVVMEFADTSFFSPGTAQLTAQAQQTLDKIAESVAKSKNAVVVEGHTDNQVVKSALYPSNWELSSARAAAVARALSERGVSPERLTASGLANTRPRASNDTEQGRKQNRRVSVIVLGN
jgi:chemotaxis protein MotB